jgi:dTMP kinase
LDPQAHLEKMIAPPTVQGDGAGEGRDPRSTRTPATKRPGVFVTFEGGEGVGKSTQVRRLAARLAAEGIAAIATREPGGTPTAELLRQVLLDHSAKPLGSTAEAILFAAARIDHIGNLIEPALEAGTWVICDRFADSTRAYQGAAGGLDLRFLQSLEHVTLRGLVPDLTFVLDLPAETGLARAARRRDPRAPADRFESETIGFHIALRQAFLAIAAAEPERCVVVDASAPEDVVAKLVWQATGQRLIDRFPRKPSHGA